MADGTSLPGLSAEQRAQMQRNTSRNFQSIGKDLRGMFQNLPSFKRGGRVKRTGVYRLHRGERVIPARSRRGGRR